MAPTARLPDAPIPLPDGSIPSRPLPIVDVPGDGRAAGRAYGEACRAMIRRHLDEALARLSGRRGIDPREAFRRAMPYRDATAAVQPNLAAEIDGVAEGAGLAEPAAAWVIQLRAELLRPQTRNGLLECTSFAVVGSASRDGGTLAGQNADLPALYQDLLVLVRRQPADGPALLTLTPAGQIGYQGMNAAGVAVFANFLYSGDWRVGVPRYLLTRIALAEPTREAAVAAVERTPRASSRNLLIADESGATNLETAADATARIEPEDGLLAHTNHHLAPALLHREEATEQSQRNSRIRLERMQALLRAGYGRLDVGEMARILRNRADAPDALCALPGEWPEDVTTVASSIAEIRARRLWITAGPPSEAAYHSYRV